MSEDLLIREKEGRDFEVPKTVHRKTPTNTEEDYVLNHCLDVISTRNEFLKDSDQQKNNVLLVQGLPSSGKTTFVGNLIYHYITDYEQLIVFTNSLDHKLSYKKLVSYVIKSNEKKGDSQFSVDECMPLFKDKKTFCEVFQALLDKWGEEFKNKEEEWETESKKENAQRIWEKEGNMAEKRISMNQDDFFKMKDMNAMLLEDDDMQQTRSPDQSPVEQESRLKKLIVFEMTKLNDILVKSPQFTNIMSNLKSYNIDVIIVNEDYKIVKSIPSVDYVVLFKNTLPDCDLMKKTLFTSSIKNGKLLFELTGHFGKYAKTHLLGKINGDANRNPETFKQNSKNFKKNDFDPSVFFCVSFM